jgi:hypothetical protein
MQVFMGSENTLGLSAQPTIADFLNPLPERRHRFKIIYLLTITDIQDHLVSDPIELASGHTKAYLALKTIN